MATKHDVAVVGATGAVGEAMLEILAQRKFPVGKLYALASERSVGKKVDSSAIANWMWSDLADFDFSQVQIGLFSAGGSISADYAPKAAAAGCVVIDNTSHFRYDDDIPLVVPEVNPDAIADYKSRGIIANPNCSTIQMVVALKPIYDAVGIERINVATYQAVSGAGRSAVEELVRQTATLLNGRPLETEGDAKQIAFNAVPHIDDIPGQSLHERRNEDGLGNAQNFCRRQHSREPDSGADSGVFWPFRGCAHRDPRQDFGRKSVRIARRMHPALHYLTGKKPANIRPLSPTVRVPTRYT